jgi:hypothetical protein
MNRKRSAVAPQSVGFDPLTIALAGVLCLAAFCSWRVHQAAGAVIDLATDVNTYATVIVEHHDNTKDIQSDNVRLEAEVNQGRARLRDAQAEAVVMMVACAGIGLALGVRVWRGRGRV